MEEIMHQLRHVKNPVNPWCTGVHFPNIKCLAVPGFHQQHTHTKIKMEPKNHPIESENHLIYFPYLHFLVSSRSRIPGCSYPIGYTFWGNPMENQWWNLACSCWGPTSPMRFKKVGAPGRGSVGFCSQGWRNTTGFFFGRVAVCRKIYI